MQKKRWVVDRIGDDGWSQLRRDMFIYMVPVDVLPDDLSEGDVLQTTGSRGDDYGRWTLDRRRAS